MGGKWEQLLGVAQKPVVKTYFLMPRKQEATFVKADDTFY